MKRLALLFAFCACHPAPGRIGAPEVGDAKTAIYVVAGEGRAPLVYVADLARPSDLPELATSPGETLELFALHYACPPANLGLTAGRAELVAEGGHPLPPAMATYRAVLSDSGASPWEASEHPELARSLRIAREIRCAKYDLRRVAIVGTDGDLVPFGAFAIPIGENEAIVSVVDSIPSSSTAPSSGTAGGFFRVTPTSVDELPSMRSLPGFAIFRERPDRVWLFGQEGSLAVGDPFTGEFEMRPPLRDVQGPRYRAYLDGSRGDAPFELFAVTDRGLIARFDGTSWSVLYRGPAPRRYRDREGRMQENLAFRGGVVWTGPTQGIGVWEGWQRMRMISTSTVTLETVLPEDSGDNYVYGTFVPALGVVIGTAGGRIFVRRDGMWTQYEGAPLERSVSATATLDDGLLIGGGLGTFTQLQPELERSDKYCHYERQSELAVEGLMPPHGFGQFFVSDILPLGCGYVFVSKATFSGEVEIGFLGRR